MLAKSSFQFYNKSVFSTMHFEAGPFANAKKQKRLRDLEFHTFFVVFSSDNLASMAGKRLNLKVDGLATVF